MGFLLFGAALLLDSVCNVYVFKNVEVQSYYSTATVPILLTETIGGGALDAMVVARTRASKVEIVAVLSGSKWCQADARARPIE